MMSMLRWCLDEQPRRTVHLFYGVRNGGEHAFKATSSKRWLRRIRSFNCTWCTAIPGQTTCRDATIQHAGHVNVDLLRRTLPHGSPPVLRLRTAADDGEPGARVGRMGSCRGRHPLRGLRPRLGHLPARVGCTGRRERRRGRDPVPALRPNARVGRPGGHPARLCGAPRRCRRVRLSLWGLRQLRDPARLRHGAIRADARPRRSRQGTACCAWARRTRPW